MKKIFQIAAYDFRRLILNPISLITMIVILIGCLILGATYKIPTAPEYTVAVSGETTREVYTNFNSSSPDLDTKTSLNKLISDAENYIAVQKSCSDYATIKNISNKFVDIKFELEKYKIDSQHSTYIENNNIDEIKSASQALQNFVTHYKNLDVFESNVFFMQTSFDNIERISAYLIETVNSGADITTILDDLADNLSDIDLLNSIVVNEIHTWNIDSEKLDDFQTTYIDKAKAKVAKIDEEITRINNLVNASDVEYASSLKSLITNYKLTCESAKMGIQYEAYLLLDNHIGYDKHFKSIENLYKYEPIVKEETKIALTKINYHLNDTELYYTDFQVPLNFNTASHQISVYDNVHFLISIIGFITILFGIFCAYKLFGQDRKNGKMDVILSQDVRFGQVFAAKFLAIVLSTLFILGVYLFFMFAWSLIFYSASTSGILAVFNLTSAYTIHPFLFMLIKVLGIELQVIFYVVITIFLMNISRKFEITFGVALAIFVVATICNIFLNGSLIYCLFPFIHADLTAFLGGGMMNAGFLQTPLYAYGNFFISLVYYLVVVVLLYSFTNQLFKKN